LEAINISTELAIKNKKNKEDQDVRDTVGQEYHHLLDVFEKGEKTTVPPHQPGIDLRMDQEEEKTVPMKKIYALSYDQLEELHRYIKQNEYRGLIRRVKSRRAPLNHLCQGERWQAQALRQLSRAQQSYQERLTPAAAH